MVGKRVIVIHGGCGLIPRKSMTPEYEDECRLALRRSLQAGHDVLMAGGSAMDAVVAAVVIMEDHPRFNAGKGSVFTTHSRNELDAGVMDGWSGRAGGASTVTTVKNPVVLARRIMDSTPHVVLCGPGAESYAEKEGLEMVTQDYFATQLRLQQLQKVLESASTMDGIYKNPVPKLDHDVQPTIGNDTAPINGWKEEKPMDTVGAVALDSEGRLATASSTGGMTGKLPGRLSDSCIPGAGYWADKTIAVSMTGNGDQILRTAAAHEIANMVKYAKMETERAAKTVVSDTLSNCHAGAIVLDSEGSVVMPYNTEGMFRGYMKENGTSEVSIWEY